MPALHLPSALLLLLLSSALPALVDGLGLDTTSAPAAQVPATALEVPRVRERHARDAADYKDTAVAAAVGGSDGPALGPRRRPREQWDFVGPALLLGGTLTALMLAAIGHLASKALLASMLSAALSAVQLARPPQPRPG